MPEKLTVKELKVLSLLEEQLEVSKDSPQPAVSLGSSRYIMRKCTKILKGNK